MITAKAASLDRTSQEEVDKYNELLDEYKSMIFPKAKQLKESENKQMEELFNSLFKKDKIQPLRMTVGDPISETKDFKNKSIKDIIEDKK